MLGDECALCLHSLLAPPHASKVEERAEGARDDAQVSSRCASSLSLQVMNTDFPVGIADSLQLVEQLGIDHRAPRFEGMLMQKIGAQTCNPFQSRVRPLRGHMMEQWKFHSCLSTFLRQCVIHE
jgi:hypothetical protein